MCVYLSLSLSLSLSLPLSIYLSLFLYLYLSNSELSKKYKQIVLPEDSAFSVRLKDAGTQAELFWTNNSPPPCLNKLLE